MVAQHTDITSHGAEQCSARMNAANPQLPLTVTHCAIDTLKIAAMGIAQMQTQMSPEAIYVLRATYDSKLLPIGQLRYSPLSLFGFHPFAVHLLLVNDRCMDNLLQGQAVHLGHAKPETHKLPLMTAFPIR